RHHAADTEYGSGRLDRRAYRSRQHAGPSARPDSFRVSDADRESVHVRRHAASPRVRELRAGLQRTRDYRARSARRTLVEMTAIADIPVRLADGSTSGLASIVQQFLE